MAERLFPVLLSSREWRKYPDCPRAVPWSLLAAHEAQALRNHDQTLERLAERGGLDPLEINWVVTGRRWSSRHGLGEAETEEQMQAAVEWLCRAVRGSP